MTETQTMVVSAVIVICLAVWFCYTIVEIVNETVVLDVLRKKPNVRFTNYLIYMELKGSYGLREIDDILFSLEQKGRVKNDNFTWVVA